MIKDTQSRVERALRKSKYKNVKDFREKDSMRSIMIQWNRMNQSQRNAIPKEQLEYLISQAEANLRPDLFLQASRIYNKKVSAEQTTTPEQRRQKTRQANKRTKELYSKLSIKEAIEKTGVRADTGNQLLYKFGKGMAIPNPNMIDMTLNEIIEDRIAVNKMLPKKKRKDIDEIIKATKTEYNAFKKVVKGFDQEKLQEINKQSLKDINGMLFGYTDAAGKPRGGYFKYAIDKEANDEIKRMMKHLTVQQRYQIMELMLSEKFMGIYCSDQESECYDENWREKRQQDLLKILRNETGKIMYVDSIGRKRFKTYKDANKSNYYTIQNFI